MERRYPLVLRTDLQRKDCMDAVRLRIASLVDYCTPWQAMSLPGVWRGQGCTQIAQDPG